MTAALCMGTPFEVVKEMASLAGAVSMAPPAPLTKRKKDADKKTIFVRQMMLLPSISEKIAVKLYDHFGNLPSLQKALTEKTFPKIRLDDRQCIGKGRVKKLAAYLL